MASPTTLQGLVAVSGKGIKPLGYLCWFSVPDEAVGLRKLKQALGVHGLPLSIAPKDTKAINTFKRAMREQEGRRIVNGRIIETAVAKVVETGEDCVYQISRITKNLDERVVDYPKAMRVIFNKTTEALNFNPLREVERDAVLSMMEEIQDFYDRGATKITGARVRSVVRNYLRSEPDETRDVEGLSGENLRGKAGGIYFIPARNEAQLTALSAALEELYPGRAYLHAVPLADGASEREIIRRHHVTNTRQEMKEAMAEVRGLLSGERERAPRSDVVANHYARYRAMQRRSVEYANLLKDEQDELAEMSIILKRQLDKLIG